MQKNDFANLPRECRNCKFVKQAIAMELDRLKSLLIDVKEAGPAQTEYASILQKVERTPVCV